MKVTLALKMREGDRRLWKAALLVVMLAGLLVLVSFAQKPTGPHIIQKVNEVLSPESSRARAKMTIATTSGDTRTFLYESWSKNSGEKTLMRYLEPSRIKDQAVLMLNNADDIWMFFPRTQRVRKMATHAKKQKMQGSDFSYEDMGGGDAFIDDFTAVRLADEKKEGHACFKLELTRRPGSDLAYSRMILWVIKESYAPIAIDYYHEEDPSHLEKQLVASDIQVIDDIPTAMTVVMFNRNDNTQTSIRILEVRHNLVLDDSLFTERALKK
jgi:outer membrane lipoprotein-sorting protein